MILDWAEKSGIMAPKVSSSNDKPELRFGVPDMEDLSIRRRGLFQWECFAELKNPVIMVPVAAKKTQKTVRRVEPNIFESRSRCVQLHQLALRAYPLRLRISIGVDHFHKITWSCSKGMCQCRWAAWSTASNVCDCSTSSDRLETTLIPFWHRMIQCMAPLQKRPGLKRSFHFDFHMILQCGDDSNSTCFKGFFSVWLMNHDDYPLDHVTVHIKQWSPCTLVAARHYIVMELRGNLTKDFRGEALARFFDASFKCLGAWVDGGRRRLNWPDSAWNEDEHFDELSYQGRNSTTDTTHFIIFHASNTTLNRIGWVNLRKRAFVVMGNPDAEFKKKNQESSRWGGRCCIFHCFLEG